MRDRVLRAGLAVMLVGLAACGDDAHSTLEVRPRASLVAEDGLAGLGFRVGSDVYAAGAFAPDENGLVELGLRVPNRGMLEFGLQLRQDGVLVAQGTFELEMTPNYEWGMDIFRQVDDPTLLCLGCAGVRRFEIAEAYQNQPGEAVWVAWGGRERGSGIVY